MDAARVAKLADAPDLGLRNRRFLDIAFRFKMKRFYQWEMPFLVKSRNATNGEQKVTHSSTNSSTQTRQTLRRLSVDFTGRALISLILEGAPFPMA